MELSEQDIQEALSIKQYKPYYRIWVAIHPDTKEKRNILKPTARTANDLARKGWYVWEIK